MKIKAVVAKGLAVWIALLSLLVTVQASETEVSVLQTSTNTETLIVFLNGALPLDGATCKVSNQTAPVVRTGTVSDGDAIVKTTVLVDISTSIPVNMRDKVISAIDKLIEQKAPSDEYRLVTFAEAETVLCDFTADRYDVGKAAENIVFNGQSSMIYDAIYNTIPSFDEAADVPTLCRTVVITDGVDLTKIGVTMEELFLKLQSERYPVDVLAVSGAAGGTANKELSAITRISGGRYCTLDPSTDLAALAQALEVGSYSYLEVKVPEQLLDGSVRQVDLSIGTSSISMDVKFPAIYTQPEPTVTPPPAQTPAPAPTPTPEPVPEPTFVQQYGWLLLVALAAVIAIVLVVVLIVFSRRRKKAPELVVESSSPGEAERRYSQETVPLLDDVRYTIKISAPKRPGKEWVLDVTGELLIGRANHCDVQLEDSTVSREHCRIVPRGDRLELIHMGTNRTLLNGVKVTADTPLNSGDLLDVGREQLRLDYIQKLDASVENDARREPSDRTQPLF